MFTIKSLKHLFVWTFILAVVSGSYYYRTHYHKEEKKLFFPELSNKINEVETIKINKGNQNFVLEKNNEQWLIQNKAKILVDNAWLRELLLGLSDMKIIEAKTQNPNVFSDIQVDLPNNAESKAIQICLNDKKGTELVDVIIGRYEKRPSQPHMQYIFVRLTESAQSYLVEGHLPDSFNIEDIAKNSLLDINNQNINKIKIESSNYEFALYRKQPELDFELENIPEGKKIRSKILINEIGHTLNNIHALDLFPDSEIDLNWSNSLKITLSTFEGKVHEFSILNTDNKSWLISKKLPNWVFEIPLQKLIIVDITPEKLFEDIPITSNITSL